MPGFLSETATTARGRAVTAAVAWRWRAQLHVTVVVKATFAFAEDAPMPRIEPQEILRADVHFGRSPARSARFTGDLAPRLSRADVLFTGHAYAPPGGRVQRLPVRLGISDGQRWLLEKSLVIQDGAGFEKMPLVYEGAFGGIGVPGNPVGVGAAPDSGTPNIVDPRSPQRPGGFGPISRTWLTRRGLLGSMPRAALEGSIAEIPDTFNWAYFQAAPDDQQIDFLRGDEWIVMVGLLPSLPSARTRLPGVRGLARIHGLDGFGVRGGAPLAMSIDTLRVDGEQQCCTVVCRGAFTVPGDEALGAVQIEAGVESAGEPVAWADVPGAPKPERLAPYPVSDEPTISLSDEDLQIEGAREESGAPFLDSPSSILTTHRPVSDEVSGTLMLSPEESARATESSAVPFPHAKAPKAPEAPPWAAPVPPGPSSPSATPFTPVEPRLSSAAQFFHRVPPSHAAEAPGIVTPLLELSRGATDTIPVVTRTPFIAFTVPCQVQPPEDARTVVVKGTFDIVPGGPATLRAEGDAASGDVHAGDDPMKSLFYPSDFAIFKPKADVTLKGHAYAPGGSSPAGEVRFRFGHRGNGFDRRIAVFGERRWEKTVLRLAATEPRRFEKIPLVYEHAFGGPEIDANPVGLGGHTRLPSLEDPAHLVRSPEDAPAPVGFGAVPVRWKARWSKLGSYDAEWLKSRWPYFPDDLDWAHFQAAPAAQQLEYLEGDEPFELVGMHPRHPSIRGQLPRLRPRCFLQQTTAAGGHFREVVLRLDTVVFDVDEMKINLVWRGLVKVRDDDASDIAELFVMREDEGTRRLALEDVHAKYWAAKIPARATPSSPDGPFPENDGGAPDEPSPHEAMIREKLRIAGLAGAAGAVLALTSPAPPDAAAAPPKHLPPERDPIRAAVVARLASGERLDGLDLAEANLSDLDFSARSLVRANLKGARLCRCRFVGADLSGAQLAKADLADAILDGAILAMADFTGANLEAASAERVDVTRADFSGARGERARFTGARGSHARFAGGTWTRARFDRAEIAAADFTKATLDEAVFDGAVAPKITLYEAIGAKVSWKQADLTAARADGVCLLRSSFQEVTAPSSNWEGAVLDDSTFLDAVLTGAGFARASCARVVFSGVDLAGARFTRASLAGASLLRTNLMKASLESADLTGADLRGASLHAAETWKAKLGGARLELAIVTQTKLQGRS